MKLAVLAGPNGAGKSTYSNLLLVLNFLPTNPINLDYLERFIDESKLPHDMLRYQTAKENQLEKLFYKWANKAIKKKEPFSFENNLSFPAQLHAIKPFADNGYHISIVYLCLDNIEHSKARVAKRMAGGGHYVSEEKLIENFNLGLQNLDEIYLDADEVFVMENNQELNQLRFSFHIKQGEIIKYFSTPKCFEKGNTPKLLKLISKYKKLNKG